MSRKLKTFDCYLSLRMHGVLGKDVLEMSSKAKLQCRLNGLTYYSPCDYENVNPNRVIDLKPNLKRMKGYVKKDDSHVDRCRVLLLLTGDYSSSGTLWEAGRMYYRNHRPIIIVSPKMAHHELTNFTTVKAAKVCATIEDATVSIKKYLKRGHK